MRIITKRNGSILMASGVLLTFIGVFGGAFYYSLYGKSWTYTPLGLVLAFFMILAGPTLSIVGIFLFITGTLYLRKVPLKLIGILRNNTHAKISLLAQQLAINERNLEHIFRLQLSGEPILIDRSTSEVIYNPALPPPPTLSFPSAEVEEPSTGWTLYEKLSIIISIIGILASIIVALLR